MYHRRLQQSIHLNQRGIGRSGATVFLHAQGYHIIARRGKTQALRTSPVAGNGRRATEIPVENCTRSGIAEVLHRSHVGHTYHRIRADVGSWNRPHGDARAVAEYAHVVRKNSVNGDAPTRHVRRRNPSSQRRICHALALPTQDARSRRAAELCRKRDRIGLPVPTHSRHRGNVYLHIGAGQGCAGRRCRRVGAGIGAVGRQFYVHRLARHQARYHKSRIALHGAAVAAQIQHAVLGGVGL